MPSRTIYLEDVTGIDGSGIADAMSALRGIVQSMNALPGHGEIVAQRGATYRLVSNETIPDKGLALSNVRLITNGASFNIECDGACYGMRMDRNATIEGDGSVNVVSSTNLPAFATSAWHAPISFGYCYLDPDRLASGQFFSPANCRVRDGLTVSNARIGGTGIAGIGDLQDVLVEDVAFPDSANMALAVGFDWSWYGSADVFDSSMNFSPALARSFFDAGSWASVHPRNVEVRRLSIGALDYTAPGFGSHGVRLSGCRDVVVDRVNIAKTTYAGFFNTAGDAGWEFAPYDEKTRAAKGVRVRRIFVNDASSGWGIYVDWLADNVYRAMTQSGYSPLFTPILSTDIEIENVRSAGPWNNPDVPPSIAANDGFFVKYSNGGRASQIFCRGHKQNMNIGPCAAGFRLSDSASVFAQLDGIVVGGADTSTKSTDCVVESCVSFGSGADTSSISNASGIHDVMSVRTKIVGNMTGSPGESRQMFGVRTNPNTLAAQVVGNHCLGVKQGGGACLIGATEVAGTCSVYRDNTAESGITPYLGSTSKPPAYIPA